MNRGRIAVWASSPRVPCLVGQCAIGPICYHTWLGHEQSYSVPQPGWSDKLNSIAPYWEGQLVCLVRSAQSRLSETGSIIMDSSAFTPARRSVVQHLIHYVSMFPVPFQSFSSLHHLFLSPQCVLPVFGNVRVDFDHLAGLRWLAYELLLTTLLKLLNTQKFEHHFLLACQVWLSSRWTTVQTVLWSRYASRVPLRGYTSLLMNSTHTNGSATISIKGAIVHSRRFNVVARSNVHWAESTTRQQSRTLIFLPGSNFNIEMNQRHWWMPWKSTQGQLKLILNGFISENAENMSLNKPIHNITS